MKTANRTLTQYLLWRLMLSLISLWGIITVLFWVIEFLPGDFYQVDQMNPAVKNKYLILYGTEQSSWQRYISFLKGSSQGMIGPSLLHNENAEMLLKPRLMNTFFSGGLALGISAVLGFVIGLLSLFNFKFMKFFWFLTQVLISIPNLVLGSVLVFIFGVWLQYLPAARVEEASGWILPILVLSVKPTLSLSRIFVIQAKKILSEQFLKNALVQGYSKKSLLIYFLARPVMISVLAVLPGMIASLLGGSLLVESLFSISGLGSFYLEALLSKDVFVIAGLSLIFAGILVAAQLIVDVLVSILDPRIRLDNT